MSVSLAPLFADKANEARLLPPRHYESHATAHRAAAARIRAEQCATLPIRGRYGGDIDDRVRRGDRHLSSIMQRTAAILQDTALPVALPSALPARPHANATLRLPQKITCSKPVANFTK